MKTHMNLFAAVLALILSGGLMGGCSQQGVDGELPGLGKDRPSGMAVSEKLHATLT